MLSRLLHKLNAPRSNRVNRRVSALATQSIEGLEQRSLLSSVTVNLSASQDGTLYEDANGAKANGSGKFLFAGPNGNANRRGLIQFDIADAIPEGAVITDVTLTLHNSGGIKNSRNVFLHPVTSEWGTGASDAPNGEYAGTESASGDATWLHTFYEGRSWSTPGGDYAGSSASAKVVLPGFYEWSSDGMIADVQEWLDNPEANHGWLLRSNESAKSLKRFDSREHNNESRRPDLSITYEIPVSPTTIEGRKWRDDNVNGLRDPSEPWLNGWTIELYDSITGEFLQSTTTADIDLNEDGQIDPGTERGVYSFTTDPGTYEVREILRDDWSQSYPGFAADIGEEGKASASGGMTLVNNVLHFDFDVDTPNGVPLTIDFMVPSGPNGTSGRRFIESRPSQGSRGEDRIVGTARLTSEEVAHLLRGDLDAVLVNSRRSVKADGPVQASGSHIVTASSGEVISERNFGNYQFGNRPAERGPIEVDEYARRGIHFGSDDAGRTTIVIAPSSVFPNSKGTTDPGVEAPTPQQIASLLKFVAKRDSSVADAIDELFGGEDPLDVLV